MSSQNLQQTIQQNSNARNALLATGTPMRKNLGVAGPFSPGQTARVKLDNIGVLTSLDIVVTASIDITSAATASKVGVENLVPSISFSDFDNVDRVVISARQLRALNSIRQRRGYDDDYADAANGAPIRVLPTAVGNGQIMRFQIRLPLAYDPNSDLRGAVLAQTIRGEQYVTLKLADGGGIFGSDDDAVYSAGAGTVSNIQVQVFQNYIQPQNIGGHMPLPLQDLLTVYELNGTLKSSDGLAVNQAKHIYYPNVRQVLSSLHTYMNGGVLAYGTDVKELVLNANSNTDLKQYNPLDLLSNQRNLLGTDLIPGTYYIDTRRVPIDTQLYGNVQFLFTPSDVQASAYVESMFESFYLKGTTLPGINVG